MNTKSRATHLTPADLDTVRAASSRRDLAEASAASAQRVAKAAPRRILAILTVLVALVLCLGVRNARSGPATPAAATTPFVFWPGGIADPATSVYTDWTSLYVAASAVTNPTVIVDDSAGAAEVPSGTWTVDGWTLESGSNDWATLYFADGALMVLHNNLIVDQGLTLETEATSAPTFTALPGYYPTIFFRGASYVWNTSATAAPFFYAPSGSFLYIFVGEASVFESLGAYHGGGYPLVQTDLGGFSLLTFGDQTTMGPQVLSGPGRYQITWTQVTSAVYSYQPGASAIGWYSGPAITAAFGASASLVGTTAPQGLSPGSGPTTTTSTGLGVVLMRGGVIGDLAVRFAGDAANVAGQTAEVECARNGGPIGTGLSVSGLPTTAGLHTGWASLPLTVYYDPEDVVACSLTTGSLSAPLTSIMVTLGNDP